jgi:hypothetical protein
MGVVILQYDGDTIIMFKDDKDMVLNVKILLYLFECISGLKINFEKSELLLTLEDYIKNVYSQQLVILLILLLGIHCPSAF